MNPTMSVFTIVHRALPPLSLPWKRRSLKGKAPLRLDLEISDKANLPEPESEIQNLQNAMHRDVFNVQVAVSDARHHVPQSPPTPENIQRPDSDSAVKPESRASSSEARSRVSWASIVCSRDRWTVEQERELLHAQRQLEKCQRDWSPKQEIWLAYVCISVCFIFNAIAVAIIVIMQFISQVKLFFSISG
jgi:hypothetical protein